MLSQRKQKFLDEFLKDRNAAAAYVRAGYSKKGARQAANKLLRSADIQAAIADATKVASTVAGLTVADVLAGLKTETGSESPAGRVRAWELLGKHLGMFPNKHQLEGKVKHSIEPVKIEIEVVKDVRKNPASPSAG